VAAIACWKRLHPRRQKFWGVVDLLLLAQRPFSYKSRPTARSHRQSRPIRTELLAWTAVRWKGLTRALTQPFTIPFSSTLSSLHASAVRASCNNIGKVTCHISISHVVYTVYAPCTAPQKSRPTQHPLRISSCSLVDPRIWYPYHHSCRSSKM
jgi:hypothetical protein